MSDNPELINDEMYALLNDGEGIIISDLYVGMDTIS